MKNHKVGAAEEEESEHGETSSHPDWATEFRNKSIQQQQQQSLDKGQVRTIPLLLCCCSRAGSWLNSSTSHFYVFFPLACFDFVPRSSRGDQNNFQPCASHYKWVFLSLLLLLLLFFIFLFSLWSGRFWRHRVINERYPETQKKNKLYDRLSPPWDHQ